MREAGMKARATATMDHNFYEGELITFVEVSQYYSDIVENIYTFTNEDGLEQDLENHEFEWIETEMQS